MIDKIIIALLLIGGVLIIVLSYEVWLLTRVVECYQSTVGHTPTYCAEYL